MFHNPEILPETGEKNLTTGFFSKTLSGLSQYEAWDLQLAQNMPVSATQKISSWFCLHLVNLFVGHYVVAEEHKSESLK